ncbi:transposase family protein [Pseudogracilibacillus sp. SO30301A]|uniref:transposase family protein n=1 Tax=Pseudogracilibacillus sp. SO30301A TaxID=3098291 RepID=UPI003FA7D845
MKGRYPMARIESEIDMYQAALQLEKTWYVERREFNPETGRIDLYLNFDRKGLFTCVTCGTDGLPFHDLVMKRHTWRHLDFWEHYSYLHMPLPRVRC